MRLPAITPRQIVMPLVVLLCGALVLYPIGFLINASLNVGDPSAFPPEEYGLDNFVNLTDGTELDQAWAAFEFDGSLAFVSAHIPGTQLDPSSCEPLCIVGGTDVNPITPVIPGGVLGDGNPPAGTGPNFVPAS